MKVTKYHDSALGTDQRYRVSEVVVCLAGAQVTTSKACGPGSRAQRLCGRVPTYKG
jgi:hypothetical protein